MKFSLKVLGSNSGLPIPKRFSTAQVLNVQERFFLIDCGEGTQIQIRRYKVGFNKINHILISHLHGDHFFGIFGLLSSFSMCGRKTDLHLYAHSDLEKILNDNSKYFNDYKFKIVFHSLNFNQSELIFEVKVLTIHSFPLKHRIPCCGFVFREKPRPLQIKKDCISFYKISIKDILKVKSGLDFIDEEGKVIPNSFLTHPSAPSRSFAFCSDTSFYPSIVEHIRNVNLLYHEATYSDELTNQAKLTLHSTSRQAAEIAKMAKVDQLLIGHYSARYDNTDLLLTEAKSVFSNTLAVYDGFEIEIPLKH